jgi:hypothetical protein
MRDTPRATKSPGSKAAAARGRRAPGSGPSHAAAKAPPPPRGFEDRSERSSDTQRAPSLLDALGNGASSMAPAGGGAGPSAAASPRFFRVLPAPPPPAQAPLAPWAGALARGAPPLPSPHPLSPGFGAAHASTALDLGAVVRDAVAGRARPLPLGLRLDAAALSAEMARPAAP